MALREVPVRTKVLYGVADTALSVKNASLNQFLLFFYADVLHVAPALVGAAIFAGKLWDAVTDPLMGYISDATRSRWGRRRPWIVASAVPMGICYYLLFIPPQLTATGLAIYLALLAILLFTFFTMFATPYLAWGAELARDYHERTTVVQIRALFGVLGGIMGATLPILIASRFDDERAGFGNMAIVLGAVISIATLVTGAGVRERLRQRIPAAGFRHFIGGLRRTLANRDFFVVFATFCLMTVSAAIGQSVQLIVIKYHLRMYEFYPWIALTFALSFACSFPLWLQLSRRIGKRRALLVGLALGCIAPLGWVVVQPGQQWAMLLFMVAGGTLAGSLTLAISQAADIVDFDELETGEQRAGAYFGIWTLGLKTSGALGTLIGGFVLGLVGYVPEQAQDAVTLQWLVVIVGPLQAVVHLGGLLVFRRIRFEEADVARVQAALEARRAANSVPVSQKDADANAQHLQIRV
jgi:GPH family glycoside/pentoside/hexuronide:cation symporter